MTVSASELLVLVEDLISLMIGWFVNEKKKFRPTGPMAGVGHVGAAFIRRRTPIIPPLPRSFPLGSQGVQATVFKKTVFVCSPGAAVENPQFFR